MTRIVGVKFKSSGKVYYFSPGELDIKVGEMAVVETARGTECGEVCIPTSDIPDENVVAPLKQVIRIATEEDKKRVKENIEKSKKAFDVCTEKIEKLSLDMKLVDVEYVFDGSKILFYFTSGGRVDFRVLVKELASVFRTRIELRQIGVRDEAKMLGGLGICGRPFCCNSFLADFIPVSIKMAKEQNLSLNPTKISGTCGRLMCCLQYEQEAYEDLASRTPGVGAVVKTQSGTGTVVGTELLRGRIKVKLEKGEEISFQDFSVNDVKQIKSAPARRKKNDEEDNSLKKLEG